MATFDLTAPEQWHPIPGHPGYELSSHFRARCWFLHGSRSRRLSPEPHLLTWQRHHRRKYPQFIAYTGGRPHHLYLHRLVALMVHGPCPPGLWVLHRDDDPSNCHPDNLYYGPPAQNGRDMIRNGNSREAKGDTNSNAILSDDAVRAIRAAWDARTGAYGERKRLTRELGERFGISPRSVEAVAERRRWAHVV